MREECGTSLDPSVDDQQRFGGNTFTNPKPTEENKQVLTSGWKHHFVPSYLQFAFGAPQRQKLGRGKKKNDKEKQPKIPQK